MRSAGLQACQNAGRVSGPALFFASTDLLAAAESIHETLDDADKAIDVLEAIVMNTPDALPELLMRLRIARRVGPRVNVPPKAPSSTPSDKAA